jgi:hypothetical protein
MKSPNQWPGVDAGWLLPFSTRLAPRRSGRALGSAMLRAMNSALLAVVLAALVLLGTTPSIASDSDSAEQGIDGVWTGESTNDMFRSMLSIKLTTNGYGAAYGGGEVMGAGGTFTYSLSHGQIHYLTNDTPFMTGTFSYDATNDIIVYKERAEVAKALRESGKPLLLQRDTNEIRGAMLHSMIGATNYTDLMTRLGHLRDSVTNHTERLHTNTAAQKSTQQDGPANESQPFGSATNRNPSASGFSR